MRYYDDPLTAIEHEYNGAVRKREMSSQEQHERALDRLREERHAACAVRLVDRIFGLFLAVLAGLALGGLLWGR